MEYLSDKSSVARMDKNLEKISPFELKNRLIEMADESVKKMAHVMLNAAEVIPTGLQRRLVKHSSPWAVLALKSVAGSWTCPKALPVFLKKQA